MLDASADRLALGCVLLNNRVFTLALTLTFSFDVGAVRTAFVVPWQVG